MVTSPVYSIKDNISPTRVLVIGGSYGGLAAGLNLLDLCNGKRGRCSREAICDEIRPQVPVRVKFVDERDGYYHLIGSPLALASDEYAAKAWVKFEDIPALKAPSLSWMQGSAISIDPTRKVAKILDTKSGKEVEESYDYLIAATGLRRTWPVVPQSLTRETYLSESGNHIKAVTNASEGVVVIGGGAVGIEMAAELKMVEPTAQVTLIHSHHTLLSSEPLPDEFKAKSLEFLEETGVKVILSQRVKETTEIKTPNNKPVYTLTLSNGSQLQASHVIFAISHSIPTTTYLPSKALDKEGYVKIDARLNLPTTTPHSLTHYAIGDIASWSGIKRCGAAMAMGYNAAANIYQQLLQIHYGKEPKFVEWPEIPPAMGLAIGKKAVCYGGPDGVVFGEEQMKLMFGDDLGFSICWNWMQLGVDGSIFPEKFILEKEHIKEAKDVDVEVAVIETTNKFEAVAI